MTVASFSNANRFDFTMDRSRLQLLVALIYAPGAVDSTITFSTQEGEIVDTLQVGQPVAFYEFTDDPGPS